ncbi:hypothetical protein [Xanthomonas campestris]|uniref:hypothetical protein n=1 Tax=Xanthomonas campestris TaxID=339 RepID=UPI001E639162|nr:hypothetical protein [Xanthomonas campestris]
MRREVVNFSRNLSAVLIFLGSLLLAGCQQGDLPEKAVDTSATKQKNSREIKNELLSQQKSSEGKERMTSLYQVVSLLAVKNGTPWENLDVVPGVRWQESSPQLNPDSTSPQNSRSRSGIIVLEGFGLVDVPDGNEGVDAGIKNINEGESGITLEGDAQYVHSVAIKKFYVSPKYVDVVRRQLPATSTVQLIAGDCGADMNGGPDTQTKFYEIGVKDYQLYLEAYIDDGEGSRGPGYTTFLFTKVKPDKRIKELQCKEL